jgi:hypothetical protein
MRKLRAATGYAVIVAVCLAAPRCVQGSVSYEPVTWGTGGDSLGWASQDGVGTVSSPGGGGSPGGYLAMGFAVDPFPVAQSDAVATSADGFTGDYTSVGTATFEFLGYASSAQSLYFVSSAGGGSVWEYVLNSSAHAWESFTVGFQDGSGWNLVSGSETFATALSQVDLIGIKVEHLNLDSPLDYGLDSWQFAQNVPEPGTVSITILALLSIAFAGRCRARGGDGE